MKWGGPWGSRLLVAGLAILLVLAALTAWRDPTDVNDRPTVERVVKLVASSARADVVAEVETRGRALARLARLGVLPDVSQADWEESAEQFLSHHPGYLSIELRDLALNTRRFVAREGNADAPLVGAALEQVTREVSERALLRWREEAAAAKTVQLKSSKRGCLLVVPGVVAGEPVGLLIAVLDLEETLDHMFSDHADLGYSIAIRQGGDEIYRTNGASAATRSAWGQTMPLRLSNLDWQVEAWPEPELLDALRSRLPEMALLVSLTLVLLLASTAHFARTTHRRALEIRAAHDHLEARVAERTAELQRMSGRLLHLQDEERRRIARELHDSTCQVLSTVRMNVSRLRQLVPDNGSKLRAIVDDSERLASQAVAEVRTISYLLHPASLDDLGLRSALQWYVAGFGERSGMEVRLVAPEDLRRLPPELELCLFRVAQEALGNVHRHSGSPTALVELTCGAHEARLRVSDEGRGFPEEALHPERFARPRVGVGVASMRERVREAGGTMAIQSDARGTVLEVVVPLAPPVASS